MIDFQHGVKLGTLDRMDHAGCMIQWRNNFKVRRWCRQEDLLPISTHLEWFDQQGKDPTVRMYSVLDPNNLLVGVCGLTSIDPLNRKAEFSLYIGPENQKKGYGKKALQTLVSHGMSNLGLNSIWGESFQDNPAIGMFKALGFKHEGIRRESYFKEGRFIDSHLYSMLFWEWKKNPHFNKEQEWKPISTE